TKFTDPVWYRKYKRFISNVKYLTYLSLGVLGINIVVFFIVSMIFLVKKRKLIKNSTLTMEKLTEYVKQGSYVAAEKLVNEQLKYLSDNTDFLAFKQRLMTITKNDTKKAEESYIRFINLKTKFSSGQVLTEEEFEEIKQLHKNLDLPEISEFVAKYEKYLRINVLNKQIEQQQTYIRMLISTGELTKALSEINNLSKDNCIAEYKMLSFDNHQEGNFLPVPAIIDTISSLKNEVEQKIESLKQKFILAKQKIAEYNILEIEKILSEVTKETKDIKEAFELKELIERTKKVEKIILKPLKTGKDVYIIKKDTIVFGRKDRVLPDVDIEDRSISRDKHLKISMVENKVIAEDENSSCGTFYGGKRFSILELEDGTVLNLARVCEINVHICRGEERVLNTIVGGTVLSSDDVIRREVLNRDSQKDKKVKGLFIEGKDKNIIVLPTDGAFVVVDIGPLGIKYERDGRCKIVNSNGVILFDTGEKVEILVPNSEIEYKGVRYKVN
ncbi:MAG: FHA domain-containing protein, partial [Endomicrobiia bacterium]